MLHMGRYSNLSWLIGMGLVALVLSPVLLLAGDPALRLHRRSWRAVDRGRALGLVRGGPGGPFAAAAYQLNMMILRFSIHPLVIAMTAPARWVRGGGLRRLLRSPSARRWDRMSRGWGGERLFPDDPGFHSGVREPRRPKPTPPTDAVALDIPREHSPLD
jgi:hypothetical protein